MPGVMSSWTCPSFTLSSDQLGKLLGSFIARRTDAKDVGLMCLSMC